MMKKFSLALFSVFFTALAFAESAPAATGVDVTSAVASLDANLSSISTVGLAILGLLAAVVAFSFIKRVMAGR